MRDGGDCRGGREGRRGMQRNEGCIGEGAHQPPSVSSQHDCGLVQPQTAENGPSHLSVYRTAETR